MDALLVTSFAGTSALAAITGAIETDTADGVMPVSEREGATVLAIRAGDMGAGS